MAPNATPEQVTEYRKANGIPEKPDGYWEAPGLKDVNFQDVDKAIVAPYLPIMHELNLRPDQVAKLITFRQAEADRMVDEQMQGDAQLRQQTEDALRQEWGSQYRPHVEAMRSFITTRFGDAADALMNARMPDGTPLLGNQTVLRSLLQMSMDLNGGVPTITTAEGRALDGAGVDARMKEIEGLMKDPSSKYWKGSEANAIQAEYRKLIEAKERNASRAGAR